jgi:hypothetical protein
MILTWGVVLVMAQIELLLEVEGLVTHPTLQDSKPRSSTLCRSSLSDYS